MKTWLVLVAVGAVSNAVGVVVREIDDLVRSCVAFGAKLLYRAAVGVRELPDARGDLRHQLQQHGLRAR